jgi:hypothetical protein
MRKAKCLKTDYKKATDDQLDSKAGAVVAGLTAHAVEFPAPPITVVALQALLTTYGTTLIAYKRGGLDQKAPFLNAKAALLDALDDLANYVDTVADGNEELITDAGFVPSKTTPTPLPPPDQPNQVLVTRGQNRGVVTVECPVIAGAEYYGMVYTEGVPLTWVNFSQGHFEVGSTNAPFVIDVTKARKKTVKEMKVGVLYYFYMYASNATGVSTLSDGVSIIGA